MSGSFDRPDWGAALKDLARRVGILERRTTPAPAPAAAPAPATNPARMIQFTNAAPTGGGSYVLGQNVVPYDAALAENIYHTASVPSCPLDGNRLGVRLWPVTDTDTPIGYDYVRMRVWRVADENGIPLPLELPFTQVATTPASATTNAYDGSPFTVVFNSVTTSRTWMTGLTDSDTTATIGAAGFYAITIDVDWAS